MKDIKIPNNIDNFIEECVDKVYKEEKKNKSKKIKVAGATAAGFVTAFAIFGVANPVAASKIPVIGGIFEMFDSSINTKFTDNSTPVNKTAVDKGYIVTMSQVACDKETLYVEYTIKNEKKFENVQSGKIVDFLLSSELNVVSNGKEEVIDGYTTIRGYFVDEYTFIGFGQYSLDRTSLNIGDEAIFSANIFSMPTGYIQDRDTSNMVEGKWDLEAGFKVEDVKLEAREVKGEITNGYSINKVEESPFKMYVEIKTDKNYYPNEKEDNSVDVELKDTFWLNFTDQNNDWFLGVRDLEHIKGEDGKLIVRYTIDKTLIPSNMTELRVFVEDEIIAVNHDCNNHEEDQYCTGFDREPQRNFTLEEKIKIGK